MNALKIILYALTALDAVVVIAVVLMQEGQSGGLAGMVGGDSEFNAFSTRSGRLKLYTKISVGLLMVLIVGLTIVEKLL